MRIFQIKSHFFRAFSKVYLLALLNFVLINGYIFISSYYAESGKTYVVTLSLFFIYLLIGFEKAYRKTQFYITSINIRPEVIEVEYYDGNKLKSEAYDKNQMSFLFYNKRGDQDKCPFRFKANYDDEEVFEQYTFKLWTSIRMTSLQKKLNEVDVSWDEEWVF